jgi:uncharacterized protein YdeI (YjbR/CyaY-like superfamily)
VDIGTKLVARSALEWRGWLEEHCDTARDIWLVLYKKSSKKTGITFDEAVVEAICFGWVDSKLKGIDSDSYALRFTPRRKGANWSETNRMHAARCIAEGRMREQGRRVLPADL